MNEVIDYPVSGKAAPNTACIGFTPLSKGILMESQVENESAKISVKNGEFLIFLVIGLFVFGEIISFFAGGFSLARIIFGSLLLFLVYEGYDWARLLWGILSAMVAFFETATIILVLQEDASWGIALTLALIGLSSIIAAFILFFSNDALTFLESRKKQPEHHPNDVIKRPRPLSQYHELSEKVRANFNAELPTYEIMIVLPVPNSNEQIILMKYNEAFRNVFRCDQNGFVIWQAELPADSNDVYTNIEWKENQLMAFSRSCVLVVLDVESGKITAPKNA